MWRHLLHDLRQLVYPNLCLWCQDHHLDPTAEFCENCIQQFTAAPHRACPRCASTIADEASTEGGCVRCRDVIFHFETAIRMGEYQPPLSDVILNMKHQHGDILAEALAKLWGATMAPRLRELNPTMVVAVPLHWTRRLRRGFNIAGLMASELSKQLKLINGSSAVCRYRATPSQTTLTPAQRRENVKNAFRVRKPQTISGHRIIIVDDVLTTGSTISETAKVLKQAGASQVDVAVMAHR